MGPMTRAHCPKSIVQKTSPSAVRVHTTLPPGIHAPATAYLTMLIGLLRITSRISSSKLQKNAKISSSSDWLHVRVRWWGEPLTAPCALFTPRLPHKAGHKQVTRTKATYKITVPLDRFTDYLTDMRALYLDVLDDTLRNPIGRARIDRVDRLTVNSPIDTTLSVIDDRGLKIGELTVLMTIEAVQAPLENSGNSTRTHSPRLLEKLATFDGSPELEVPHSKSRKISSTPFLQASINSNAIEGSVACTDRRNLTAGIRTVRILSPNSEEHVDKTLESMEETRETEASTEQGDFGSPGEQDIMDSPQTNSLSNTELLSSSHIVELPSVGNDLFTQEHDILNLVQADVTDAFVREIDDLLDDQCLEQVSPKLIDVNGDSDSPIHNIVQDEQLVEKLFFPTAVKEQSVIQQAEFTQNKAEKCLDSVDRVSANGLCGSKRSPDVHLMVSTMYLTEECVDSVCSKLCAEYSQIPLPVINLTDTYKLSETKRQRFPKGSSSKRTDQKVLPEQRFTKTGVDWTLTIIANPGDVVTNISFIPYGIPTPRPVQSSLCRERLVQFVLKESDVRSSAISFRMPPSLDSDFKIQFKLFVNSMNDKSPTLIALSDLTYDELHDVLNPVVPSVDNRSTQLNVPLFAVDRKQLKDSYLKGHLEVELEHTFCPTSRYQGIRTDRPEPMYPRPLVHEREHLEGRHSDVSLETLISIPEGKIQAYSQDNVAGLNTYLVVRLPWCRKHDEQAGKTILRRFNSAVAWNGGLQPAYRFSLRTACQLDDAILSKLSCSYVVIEVWKKRSTTTTQDELLGLVKLPTDSIAKAFGSVDKPDLAVNLVPLKEQPLILHNGWISIFHPISSALRGQLQVRFIIGTSRQISRIQSTEILRCDTNKLQSTEQKDRLCTREQGEGMVEHTFGLTIESLEDFDPQLPFGGDFLSADYTLWGDCDCFVQYVFPQDVETNASTRYCTPIQLLVAPCMDSLIGTRKNMSRLTSCKFFSSTKHNQTPYWTHRFCFPELDTVGRKDDGFMRWLLNSLRTSNTEITKADSTEGIVFNLWLRTYSPNMKDHLAARATIAESDLLEILGETSSRSVVSPTRFTLRLYDVASGKENGRLNVSLSYEKRLRIGLNRTNGISSFGSSKDPIEASGGHDARIMQAQRLTNSGSTLGGSDNETFAAEIIIESAYHLRPNSIHSTVSPRLSVADMKLGYVFVSFSTDATILDPNNSNTRMTGRLAVTPRVKMTDSMCWNYRRFVHLPLNYLSAEQAFVLHVWYTNVLSEESPEQLVELIGTVSLDLSPLSWMIKSRVRLHTECGTLGGLDKLYGWYTVTDGDGGDRGQILLGVKPLTDGGTKYDRSDSQQGISIKQWGNNAESTFLRTIDRLSPLSNMKLLLRDHHSDDVPIIDSARCTSNKSMESLEVNRSFLFDDLQSQLKELDEMNTRFKLRLTDHATQSPSKENSSETPRTDCAIQTEVDVDLAVDRPIGTADLATNLDLCRRSMSDSHINSSKWEESSSSDRSNSNTLILNAAQHSVNAECSAGQISPVLIPHNDSVDWKSSMSSMSESSMELLMEEEMSECSPLSVGVKSHSQPEMPPEPPLEDKVESEKSSSDSELPDNDVSSAEVTSISEKVEPVESQSIVSSMEHEPINQRIGPTHPITSPAIHKASSTDMSYSPGICSDGIVGRDDGISDPRDHLDNELQHPPVFMLTEPTRPAQSSRSDDSQTPTVPNFFPSTTDYVKNLIQTQDGAAQSFTNDPFLSRLNEMRTNLLNKTREKSQDCEEFDELRQRVDRRIAEAINVINSRNEGLLSKIPAGSGDEELLRMARRIFNSTQK